MKAVGETSETCKIKLKNKLNVQLPFLFHLGDITLPDTSWVASHMGLEALYGKSLFPLWFLRALSENRCRHTTLQHTRQRYLLKYWVLLWHTQTTHFLLIRQQQKVSRGLSNLITRGLCYAQFCSLRSGRGSGPCCEIWLPPEALWKSRFLLCPATCRTPCWEKQGNLLNCVHLFLSLTAWEIEKDLQGSVSFIIFSSEEGSRRDVKYSWGCADCESW